MKHDENIIYKGVSTTPSDYLASEGALAWCHNMVYDGEEMRVKLGMQKVGELKRFVIVGVHKGIGFKHLVVYAQDLRGNNKAPHVGGEIVDADGLKWKNYLDKMDLTGIGINSPWQKNDNEITDDDTTQDPDPTPDEDGEDPGEGGGGSHAGQDGQDIDVPINYDVYYLDITEGIDNLTDPAVCPKGDELRHAIAEKRNGDVVKKIEAIGNILIVQREKSTSYFRWKDDKYIYLGDDLPKLPALRFGLHTINLGYGTDDELEADPDYLSNYPKIRECITEPTQSINVESFYHEGKGVLCPFGSDAAKENGKTIYDSCLGKLNELHSRASKAKAFTEPFMIRYCFRMYDGTTSRISPAVLMIPADYGKAVLVNYFASGFTMYPGNVFSFLYASLIEEVNMEDWNDLIESVDIFVSSPIYSFTQDSYDEWFRWRKTVAPYKYPNDEEGAYFSSDPDAMIKKNAQVYGAYENYSKQIIVTNPSNRGTTVGENNIVAAYNFTDNEVSYLAESDFTRNSHTWWEPHYKTTEEIKKEIEHVTSFWKISSIPIDDLNSYHIEYNGKKNVGLKKVNIDDYALENLEANEYLKEDYLSNYDLLPGYVMTYNNRLLKSNCKRDYSTDFSPMVYSQYLYSTLKECEAIVTLEKDGQTYNVNCGGGREFSSALQLGWLFYPDPYAKKLTFRVAGTNTGYEFPLKKHDMLQGAYWMPDDMTESFELKQFTDADKTSLGTIEIKNISTVQTGMVYESEVNNPFVFPSSSVVNLGSGNVIALSTNTQALSQGQFGQYPIIAFTDEGVWAIGINDEGRMVQAKPLSRDVILNENALVQTDDAVVYLTKYGVNVTDGNTMRCLSDVIKDPFFDFDQKLPNISTVMSNNLWNFCMPFIDMDINNRSVVDYLHESKLLWVPNLRELQLHVPSKKTALVLKPAYGQWSTIDAPYTLAVVNNYPGVLIQNKAGEIFNPEDCSKKVSSMIVTRPFCFNLQHQLKSVKELVQRGMFKASTKNIYSNVSLLLYGSYDGKGTWKLINSSVGEYIRGRSGSGYKMFRLVAVLDNPSDEDTLHGFSAVYEVKQNNKLR